MRRVRRIPWGERHVPESTFEPRECNAGQYYVRWATRFDV